MIFLRNCTKILRTRKRQTLVLENVDFVVPRHGVTVILGHQGSGKTTLIRLLSGVDNPTHGSIQRTCSVSFPFGMMGYFHPRQKARHVVFHIAGVYGVDPASILALLERLPGFDHILDEEMIELPGPLKMTLAYAVGYAMQFDMYLMDSSTAVGSPMFRGLCDQFLMERRRTSGIAIATTNAGLARQLADRVVILDKGKLTAFPDKDRALAHFKTLTPGPYEADGSQSS